MEELPVAITPHIRISENNQPINLYTGEIKVSKMESDKTFQANANIQLSWLPYPRIEVEMSVPSSWSILPLLEEDNISLTLNEGTTITGRLTTINTQLGISKETERLNSKLFGIIKNNPVIPPEENQIEVRRVKFLVPNFSNLLGLPVRYVNSEQTRISKGRLILRGGGWVITLDPVDQLKEIEKTLKQSSGFAITHVGQLEKDDFSPFDSTDALGILEALTFYLWFAKGAYTSPCLPTGFDDRDINPCGKLLTPLIFPKSLYKRKYKGKNRIGNVLTISRTD